MEPGAQVVVEGDQFGTIVTHRGSHSESWSDGLGHSVEVVYVLMKVTQEIRAYAVSAVEPALGDPSEKW